MQNSLSKIPLTEVKQKIADGNYVIKDNAMDSAYVAFGWGEAEIIKCLNKLEPRHYHKTEPHNFINTTVDSYHARKIYEGNNVYIHFHIRPDGKLVIASFKQLTL